MIPRKCLILVLLWGVPNVVPGVRTFFALLESKYSEFILTLGRRG